MTIEPSDRHGIAARTEILEGWREFNTAKTLDLRDKLDTDQQKKSASSRVSPPKKVRNLVNRCGHTTFE